jgi:hypothetical protein
MTATNRGFGYSFFGLNLHSNLRLPGIPTAAEVWTRPDCKLLLGIWPQAEIAGAEKALVYTSAFTDASGQPALRMWSIQDGAYFQLTYNDGHQFWFDREGKRVWAIWPDRSCLEEATPYLVGPVLGILLRHRGVVCLHASAVAIHDRAVAFVGPPGAGKSTTAAALGRRGHRVLADDITVIEEVDGDFYAQPGYAGLQLWPDSVELLYGPTEHRPRPVLEGDKARIFANDGLQFESRALPLSEIYILDNREPSSCNDAPESAGREKFLSLVANTYGTNVLDSKMRAHEFAVLGKITSRVRISSLRVGRGPGNLQACCDLFSEDVVLKGKR